MGTEESQTFCPTCKQNVLGRRETPNHILHFLISFFTCGFWLFVWALLAASAGREPYRCTRCGTFGLNSTGTSAHTPQVQAPRSPIDPVKLKRRKRTLRHLSLAWLLTVVATVVCFTLDDILVATGHLSRETEALRMEAIRLESDAGMVGAGFLFFALFGGFALAVFWGRAVNDATALVQQRKVRGPL